MGRSSVFVPNPLPAFRHPLTPPQLGQSTSYVTLDSLAILTDPALSDRTIPSRLAPQRLRPAPCTLDELRRVDVVLVSHKWVWVGGFDLSSPATMASAGTSPARTSPALHLLLGMSRRHRERGESPEGQGRVRCYRADAVLAITTTSIPRRSRSSETAASGWYRSELETTCGHSA